MKKMTYFVMALALVLGLTQCKKDQIEFQSEGNGVRITLDVENGGKATDGTRVNVDPYDSPMVTFEKGDKVLVGYNGAYVGTLTHNGTRFEGNIDATQDGDKRLYFYFVGNKQETLAVGDESCMVNISDQTKELPVLSFSESNRDFDGAGSYSASLRNQCALVKFTLDNPAGSILVGNMHTEATISFSNPSIAPTGTTGSVRLYSKTDTEKWAILLPQASVPAAHVTIGNQTGLTVDVPAITTGVYVTSISTIGNDESSLVNLSTLYTSYTAKDGDILTGTLDGTTNADQRVKISIADGAHITLSNAHILGYTEWGNYLFAGLNCIGDATIILDEGTTNEVQGFNPYFPGILIPAEKTLTIDANGAGTGSLDVCCKSEGQGAAGIGGQAYDSFTTETSCGNIVINGGVITATGAPGINGSSPAPGGAGIGGGWNVSCGTITINGGTVTANGGQCSAGIGTSSGGESRNGLSNCGSVTINGGVVVANGGTYAAGIGSGCNEQQVTCSCSSVTINGGTVTATGGRNGAGIGSGYAYGSVRTIISSCGNISITGGTVTATGGEYSAGIGTGYRKGPRAVSQCGSITIDAGVTSVTATKGSYATYSIGAGKNGTCGTVKFGDETMYNGSSWVITPENGNTYGGLSFSITTTTNENDTWELQP